MAPEARSAEARRPRRAGQLPGGRHGLSAEDVAASQRERLLDAMTEALADHRYAALRVEDVVVRSGVSRKSFYELFEGKEDCFCVVYERAMDRLLATALTAFDARSAWIDRLRTALVALAQTLAAQPRLARLCFVDVALAGGAAVRRRDTVLADFTVLFDVPEVRSLRLASTVAVGRVTELTDLLRREIEADNAAGLPEMVPELMYLMLLPILGPEAADRELDRAGAVDSRSTCLSVAAPPSEFPRARATG